MTSNDPDTTKQSSRILSPFLKMKSPGAECIISKLTARALRQPSLANRKAEQPLKTRRFKCTQMSALMSLGQTLRTFSWNIKSTNIRGRRPSRKKTKVSPRQYLFHSHTTSNNTLQKKEVYA